ncbi:conjugal transfer protein TraR [Paenibacillus sp. HJL G12]|uniref:Conjugal transfer protein TraR n=1 Tax=Paenibacillus dendrobii TaxID=2691084 RepID=A0A7X3IGI0_9BACL|nr:TraR/DksA C4-type zinc finger protein [Paenibacillus dendrobii]MWV43405.1 conjugal transfer protein TraR [Paenibacillus dendrobii]
MSHLSSAQLQELKHTLLEEKKELEHHFITNGEEDASHGESLTDSTGDLSTVDNHPADQGTDVFERERDLAVNNTLNDELDQINAALKRMEKGNYGICEVCGQDIPFERLQAIPFTAFCVDDSPEQSLRDDRPVEEQVMTPPPSGAGEGRQEHDRRFDDADAWEAVEDYGTSNSPAMAAKRDVEDYDDGM